MGKINVLKHKKILSDQSSTKAYCGQNYVTVSLGPGMISTGKLAAIFLSSLSKAI